MVILEGYLSINVYIQVSFLEGTEIYVDLSVITMSNTKVSEQLLLILLFLADSKAIL